MRLLWAGLIFILLVLPAMAWGQVSGTVESVGYDGYFRPESWTPMVITVTPETGKTDFYQIHVKLQDLDRDLPIFQRTISVTGGAEGQNRMQRFRMYFIPSPTDGGLPDATDAGALKDLQDRLKVSLHSSSGKWICDLPLTGTVHNVDPTKSYSFAPRHRGAKLVIAVSDRRSRPVYPNPEHGEFLGVLEDVFMVTVRPSDLPENVLGYDSVDAVVWLDADPSEIKSGEDEKYRALESYIRRGGRLVICQPLEWQKTLAFSNLLPVNLIGVEDKRDLFPLREMARPPGKIFPPTALGQSMNDPARDPLADLAPPFHFARAKAKPGTVVDTKYMIHWTPASENDDEIETEDSPYIVRAPLGLGVVTWVAQDLGDPMLTMTKRPWAYVYVWNRVFDWQNDPVPGKDSNIPASVKAPYDEGTVLDIKSLLNGMDLESKSAWLIMLAVVFFIGYWLVAGPGAYTYLAAKKKSELNWFIFAACAFGATGLTAGIVKLVLRGPPELRHLSIVRVAPDQPATVISRFGLYIPRDGWQRLELKDAAPDSVTSLSALPVPPALLKDVPKQTGPEYAVPVNDAATKKNAELSFKYRSTLKKFQAVWLGQLGGAVQGSAKLIPQNWIEGLVTNGTNSSLRNVYFVFNYPGQGQADAEDWILYLPRWESGVMLDLGKEFNNTTTEGGARQIGFPVDRGPDGKRGIRGRLTQDWGPWWTAGQGGRPMSEAYDDGGAVPKSLVLMSLYDRLAPDRNAQTVGTGYNKATRVDLLRRGGRMLDISSAVAAGQLVVLAEASGPLPIPLEVEGDRVTGDGTIFYQFVLPLDRTAAVAASAQPAGE